MDCEGDIWKRYTAAWGWEVSGAGPYELADYLPATVLREGGGGGELGW